MQALAGPLLAVSCVLAVSGGLKIGRPATTAQALKAFGLPASFLAVRLLGAAELLVGGGAVAAGGPWFAAGVALSYLAFAGFVLAALARGVVLSSCGCFGKPETPPTPTHVVVNLCSAVMAALAALAGAPGLVTGALDDQALGGVPFMLLTATAAYALYLSLAALPQVTRAALGRRQAA